MKSDLGVAFGPTGLQKRSNPSAPASITRSSELGKMRLHTVFLSPRHLDYHRKHEAFGGLQAESLTHRNRNSRNAWNRVREARSTSCLSLHSKNAVGAIRFNDLSSAKGTKADSLCPPDRLALRKAKIQKRLAAVTRSRSKHSHSDPITLSRSNLLFSQVPFLLPNP